MLCPNCGHENRPGRKFCASCGQPFAVSCPTCGAANDPGDRFCGECGSALPGGDGLAADETAVPLAERRLVSVLFADLVGFTTLSERRDPEEVRELLSSYFATARTTVERYGGTIEKFIGDAVMAVWGTPSAREDDAERAVRAALDLVEGVAALGGEIGEVGLAARAGVLTGEAAVTLGAEGQGMVAGDLVNSASRVQSAAAPGAVLVGEVTRRATEASIAYESAGLVDVKGKVEPLSLWRALRVVAGRGGTLKSGVLEAPFVGRDREFRLVKSLLNSSADESRAHLVSVIGIAGIGKSRLASELEKYADGLVQGLYWHRGRCLSYGDGVAYWALAEMVRMRARIVEEEEPGSAAAKLHAAVEELVADPDERRFTELRLAHLLGLEDRAAADREDLFAGWRLFFERLAERDPVVMVFEDLQWADAALLDFIEYLLEWSRNHRLFILTLARPEMGERRPTWGAGQRAFTSLALEPLAPAAMEALLDGLSPGLPADLRSRILDRAEGVPLYAVETVRMLLDRGLLLREGDAFRPSDEAAAIEDLEVPETLHALIAARLDGLSPEERTLIQNASVLGKTFTKAGLTALTGLDAATLDPLLASLVRKEVLTLHSDPRSPERGQYGFLQDLVKRVAYETVSKRDRKAKHLAVAEFLETAWGSEEGEIVEVVASHYLDAYRLAPEAEDAADIKRRARDALTKAGHRAASLAATSQAAGYFERAADLADDPMERATLLSRAGDMQWAAGRADDAVGRLEEAIALFETTGHDHDAASVHARLGEILWDRGDIGKAVERMEGAWEVLAGDEPDAEVATLASQLGRLLFFTGDVDRSAERVEQALDMAEALFLPGPLSHALNTKALIVDGRGHHQECIGLLRHALTIADEHDEHLAAARARYNLVVFLMEDDRMDEASLVCEEGLAAARRLGYRQYELNFLAARATLQWRLGDWDGAVEDLDTVLAAERGATLIALSRTLPPLAGLRIARGDIEGLERQIAILESAASEGVMERGDLAIGRAFYAWATGDPRGALEEVQTAFAISGRHEVVSEALPLALEAAFDAGDVDRAEAFVHELSELRPQGELNGYHLATVARARGRIAQHRERPEEADRHSVEAVERFRGLRYPFWLAVSLTERAEWLTAQQRHDEAAPLAAEARGTFERLKAVPWLERLDRLGIPSSTSPAHPARPADPTPAPA